MADYTREQKRILRDAGCTVVPAGKGSHEIWYSPVSGRNFPVQSTLRSRHTASAVLA